MSYYFFTDGAASRNGEENAPGGWAFVCTENGVDTIASDCGYVKNATNNICELLGALNACKYARAHNLLPAIIYSDSAYIVNCYLQRWYDKWLRNGWLNSKKEPVANRELWEELIHYFEDWNFDFSKVKGHSGVELNEKADELAKGAKDGIYN